MFDILVSNYKIFTVFLISIFVLLTLFTIKVKNHSMSISIISIVIGLLIAVLQFLPDDLLKDNKRYYLCSELYFSELKYDCLIYSLKDIVSTMKLTSDNKGDAEYFLKHIKTPYGVIYNVVNGYKQIGKFKNISPDFLDKLNSFIDKKINRDKDMLNKTVSPQKLSEFMNRFQKIFEDRKIFDIICSKNIDSSIYDRKTIIELLDSLSNEFTGLLMNKADVFSDFDNTWRYLNNCEYEFNKYEIL